MNDETIEDDDTRDELLNECAHKLTEIVLARLNELPILEKQRLLKQYIKPDTLH